MVSCPFVGEQWNSHTQDWLGNWGARLGEVLSLGISYVGHVPPPFDSYLQSVGTWCFRMESPVYSKEEEKIKDRKENKTNENARKIFCWDIWSHTSFQFSDLHHSVGQPEVHDKVTNKYIYAVTHKTEGLISWMMRTNLFLPIKIRCTRNLPHFLNVSL